MSRWLHAAGVSTEVQKGQIRQKGQKPPIGAETQTSVPCVPSVPYGLTSKHPITAPDPDAFEERAGILEYDAGLQRHDAETRAAQELGFNDAPSLQGEMARHWAAEIERLARLPAISPEGAVALKRARTFISEGWALQAARLGWDEVELFGICPHVTWRRRDRTGAAFGGAVQAVTAEAVAYVGGLRRYRAQVNNDSRAVPIWELAGDVAI